MRERALPWLALNALLWAAVGSAGTWLLRQDAGAAQGPDAVAQQVDEALDELGLDPQRRAEVEEILADHRQEVLARYDEFYDWFDEAAARTDAEIEALLREDERALWRRRSLGQTSIGR